MKKLGFIILLLVSSSSAFGQQFLWSTVKSDTADVKHVPLNDVTEEVLTFYNHYDYYFDFSGYNKKRFVKEINYGFNDWDWIYDIKNLTVFALRSNTGRGSAVLILCISKDNVNMIIFSNDILLNSNPQTTGSYEKDKFVSWFKTILN